MKKEFGYFSFYENWHYLGKTMKDKEYRAFFTAISTFMFEDKEPDFSNFPQKVKNELESKWMLILPSLIKSKQNKQNYKKQKNQITKKELEFEVNELMKKEIVDDEYMYQQSNLQPMEELSYN